MVSNCISKGYCPKEIEEPYPLITFCTLKHIPEKGGGGGRKKKKERKVFWREFKREKNESWKIKLQEKIKEYKALLH